MVSKNATAGPRSSGSVVKWLLEGDAAIRWQTLRDLTVARAVRIARERHLVSRTGWGARLLAKQNADGTWGSGGHGHSGLYLPKWTSTTYTMLLLRDLGLDPSNEQARKACSQLLDRGIQADGGMNYGWKGPSETCITGMVLSILCHFEYDDDRLDTIAAFLLSQQMADGGWNCRLHRGATHASLHTTISVLEALRLYEKRAAKRRRLVQAAQERGREFLLAHRLFRSHRTGRIISTAFTRFSFPPRWHYDILRALDHFQNASAPRDERLADAIAIVLSRRSSNGKWLLQNRHKGTTYFELERIGVSSRWNTLRALRVLKWWYPGT